MDDPTAWTEQITMESDPKAIEVIQLRLVEWGWMLPNTYEKGVLDEVTIQAVISFQQNVEMFKMMKPDPMLLMENNLEEPLICVEMFKFLFNDSNTMFTNPNPLD